MTGPSPRQSRGHAVRRFDRSYDSGVWELEWAANRRIIDRVNPGYEA